MSERSRKRLSTKPGKAQAQEALEALGRQLADAETALNELRDQAARAQADREKLESLTKQIDDLKREAVELQRRIDANLQVIRGCDELIAEADVIRAKCQEAETLEELLAVFAKDFEQDPSLGQTYVQKASERDAEVRRVETEWQSQIAQLRANVNTLGKELVGLAGKVESAERATETAQRQAVLISEAPCSDSPMAETCKLLADARQAKTSLEALETEFKTQQGLLKVCDLAISGAKSALESADAEMANAVEEARARLQAEVDEILRQKEALGYSKEAHQRNLAQFNAAKQWREKLTELSAAESKAQSANAAVRGDEHIRDGKTTQIETLEHERDGMYERMPKDIDFTTGYQEAAVQDIRSKIDAQTRAMASAETVLSQIATAEAELVDLNKSLSAGEHKRLVFATLQEAYSRDGIPALIIDAAIPQIEEYANDLLTRLSDGRMSLKFVTQKRTGSGSSVGIAETLDIFMADAAGERAYEDFSGGEQLRVNLAVRIAIGQVLAQRAGATIRTLLLDEVCSPLDQAGEDALVECITKLQSMFDCILLITHRESLKDRLPQQIEVIKGTNGSEIRAA